MNAKILSLPFLLICLTTLTLFSTEPELSKQQELHKNSQFDNNRIIFYISNNKVAKKKIKVGILLTRGTLSELHFRIKIADKVISKVIKSEKWIDTNEIHLINVDLFESYQYDFMKKEISVELIKEVSKAKVKM